MSENRSTARTTSAPVNTDDPHQALRAMGSRAHQLRAALRASDHFTARGGDEDTDTGSWLISSGLDLAQDVVADIDSLARALKERPAEPALQQTVAQLRVRAHQLLAATRAADHFLDQDTREDRDTGSWLIATALGLSHKLASEFDDSAVPTKRAPLDKSSIEPHDAGQSRRMAAAGTPMRGAA